MVNIKDDRGFNQIYKVTKTTLIRAERRNKYFEDIIGRDKPNDILEIGCAFGELSFYLANNSQNNVIGIDICTPFIEEAKRRYKLPNLDFSILDFNNPVGLNNRKFDYIIGIGILHHLYYEIDKALINLKGLLKSGGKIIFLEPNLSNPYCFLIFNTTKFFRNMAKLEPGEKAFTKRFIRNRLIKARFKDISIEYKDFLIPITPYFLIKPVIFFSNIFEKIPFIKNTSQSLFISADNIY